jgi:hypothetical protein
MVHPDAAPATGVPATPEDVPTPALYLVQDEVPSDQKVNLLLSLPGEAWKEGGLVSRVSLPRDVAVEGFTRLIAQRQALSLAEDGSSGLQQRSDRLLEKIPTEDWLEVVLEAYGAADPTRGAQAAA